MRGQRFVVVQKGTPFETAVALIEVAIHESRVRLLASLAKRDFALGGTCLITILVLAFLIQSPAGRFLAVFWITVLVFEFGIFYAIALRKNRK